MTNPTHKVAGWKGYVTDLHDIRDRLCCAADKTHPVNYALRMVGCVMPVENEALVRQVIEAYTPDSVDAAVLP